MRKQINIIQIVIATCLLLFEFGCNTYEKNLRYKASIATITNHRGLPESNGIVETLITGEPANTNNVTWSDYVFTAYNGKQYGGEDLSGFDPGERFIVMYDTAKLDNDHSYLVYYKPLFLDEEKTIQSTGKIKEVYGKDRSRQGAIGVRITYQHKLPLNGANDSIVNFTKYQYLPPNTSIDSLKKYPNKEYRLLYSAENPKRAILYLDSQDSLNTSKVKRVPYYADIDKNTFNIDLGLFYTSMFNKDFVGGNLDLKYYWSKRFCTGISFFGSSKRTTDEFGYDVKQPRLDYAGISWLNEFNLMRTNLLRMNLTLNNGCGQIELLDRSEHVQTQSSNNLLSSHAKSISYNTYYLLEPGLDIMIAIKKNSLYLTLKSKYRFAYGHTRFGSPDQVSGYYIGLNLSFIPNFN